MEVFRVEFYAGGKGEEEPRIIYTDSGIVRVDRIIETRLEENHKTGKRKRIFILKSIEGDIYCLESSEEGFSIKERGR